MAELKLGLCMAVWLQAKVCEYGLVLWPRLAACLSVAYTTIRRHMRILALYR